MYFEKEIINANGNMKHTWNLINEAAGRNKTSNSLSINFVQNDNSINVCNEEDIANEFNYYFCNVGKNISNQIIENGYNKKDFREINKNAFIPNSIFLSPCTTKIKNYINNLKDPTTVYENNPTNKVLKMTENITVPHSLIYNLLFYQLVFSLNFLRNQLLFLIVKLEIKTNVITTDLSL